MEWEFAPGDMLLDRYRVEKVIGSGGMATVYKCTDIRLNVTVAAKLLHKQHRRNPEVVRRFLREAHLQARLRHPNIVAVSNVEERDGLTFLVMELLKGIPLADYYRAKKTLDEAESLEYLIPIADALALAHEQDIVHRDIKPSNIFLAEQGGRLIPKLMDFGVARQLDASITTTSTLLGTLPYMSLELVQSARNASPASDVYALGVTLFEILTGRLPIQSSNFQEYVFALLDLQKMPRIRTVRADISQEIDDLLAHAMAKEASDRYPNARPMHDALVAYQSKLGPRRSTVRAAAPAHATAHRGSSLENLVQQRGFSVISKLGKGPVGMVFHCKDGSGRQVDVKIMHQDLAAQRQNRQLFLSAAQKQAALAHSSYYIQPILEVIDSMPAVVTAHPIGSTVEALLAQYGQFDLAYALDLFIYLTDALHAAHQAQLLHLDIYPGNILLAQTPEGIYTPQLQDFGHLRVVNGTHRAALKNRGAPSYLAPELMDNLDAATPASDIFSFGTCLFRALSGRLPCDANNFDAYEDFLNSNRSFPDIRNFQPDLPDGFAQVLGWCLAFGSAQRYQDFAQLKRDLLTVRQQALGY